MSDTIDTISEEKQKLEAQIARTRRVTAGHQILFAFFQNHPEYQGCDASTRVIEDYLRSQDKVNGFSLQDLENGVKVFGPSMAKAASRIPLPEVQAPVEPEPLPQLVPYSRRELLHLDRDTFKELYQKGPDVQAEINRILNSGRQ
jgi:hypothetical protein